LKCTIVRISFHYADKSDRGEGLFSSREGIRVGARHRNCANEPKDGVVDGVARAKPILASAPKLRERTQGGVVDDFARPKPILASAPKLRERTQGGVVDDFARPKPIWGHLENRATEANSMSSTISLGRWQLPGTRKSRDRSQFDIVDDIVGTMPTSGSSPKSRDRSQFGVVNDIVGAKPISGSSPKSRDRSQFHVVDDIAGPKPISGSSPRSRDRSQSGVVEELNTLALLVRTFLARPNVLSEICLAARGRLGSSGGIEGSMGGKTVTD
jgi:hypothetical protein